MITLTLCGELGGQNPFLLSSTFTFLAVKAWPNGSNMLVQHHPTLLNATCCTRLATMLHDVGCC